MGIKVSLEHRTTYTFERLVRVHPHVVRLRPAPHSRTRIDAYSMRVTPAEHFINWQQDAFGNFLARLVFPHPARELSITVGLIADLEAINPFDFFVEDYAEHFPFAYRPELAADLEPYLRPVDGSGVLVREWVHAHTPADGPRTIDFLVALNRALHGDVGYTIRMEPGVQSPEHTLRGALGSCRDSAWLLVSVLRELGLAARFVSGYLVQLAQDAPSLDGPSGPAADFTDLHAWAEVYLPGAGWIGLDPTSGLFAGEGHIPLAATPHPNSAAPITGATEPTRATMDFANTVRRVHEDPRVTLPYTTSQWERIAEVGAALDARMARADIGLTIGGEPTFVSIDDRTAPEWTTEADGPHKRARAIDLADRLRRIYAPTGIVQYRQGKWYPGEPLPRWEIAVAWRADGEPVWTRQDLLADPWTPIGSADTPGIEGERDSVADNGSGWPDRPPIAGSAYPTDGLTVPVPQPAEIPEQVDGFGDAREAGPELCAHSTSLGAAASADIAISGSDPVDFGSYGAAIGMPTAFPPGRESDSMPPNPASAAGGPTVGSGDSMTPSVSPLPQVAVTQGESAAEYRLAALNTDVAKSNSVTDADQARALVVHIAEGLGLPLTQVRPAFEDPLARIAAKMRLPEGDPISEPDAALLARLDAEITEPVAYVLPLYRREDGAGWASAEWRLRRGRSDTAPLGRIVLTEGDSPAGLRLPLDSISWRRPPARPEHDPFVLGPLLQRGDEPATVEPPDWSPTTALVAEVHSGRLHVFLPPVSELDDFLDLVHRVELAAAALGEPVVLEGYAPPADARLHTFSITPDPGVLEVNVRPTVSFAEQTELLATLYEQARLARLGTECFDVDGAHGGTGGGNHITLGGETPARSPLLRRPDLLVSLITYWQRHPALSYVFSGRFIGPTSQAPRVDEGREETLYELEIAFAEIDRLSRDSAGLPWQVDRALRHLLTDLTGNTHRAEFCIDKLYNPESARGRMGLVELRGFEMPPHFRMAMVQSLLVRALVAMLWEKPLRAKLIRHGANLHGRYLLPHFLLADLAEVVAELRAHGIGFELSWLDPFTEFRFPRIGTVVLGTVEVELRGAIEPWNTLGEQTVATGTARYVDSSVERLQVRVVGADRGRHVLTCNGWPVPLLATDQTDVQVAGVRYRAWQPPNSLHPSITVDAPLIFDLIDAETGLSRGGCTYHVVHPGGLAYETPPVNAVVAQSRRNRRFEAAGHSATRLDLGELRAKMSAQFADSGARGILDLRRARTVWTTFSDR